MKVNILDSYLNYRKHKPEYADWKRERTLIEEKRKNYIEKNGMSEAQKAEDLKRAEAIINAVDVMDEFSQTRAEDMEMTVQQAIQAVSTPLSYVSMAVGLVLGITKPGASLSKKIAKSFGAEPLSPFVMPMLTSIAASLASIPVMSAWGAKKELEASRMGRLEAMQNDLASVKQFAILDDNQTKQRDEIAKTIDVPKKDVKKFHNATKGLGFVQSIKMLAEGDDDYEIYNEKFLKQLKEDTSKFDTVKLTEKEILEAKKDKQLISNIVEKIDIASQDYAENIELATGVMGAVALGSGGLFGVALNKILKLCKVEAGKAKSLATLAGVGAALAGAVYATKIQKQASRVARFKVKQDLMRNPYKLYYVDDEKIANDKDTTVKPAKKESFMEFMSHVIKDNKEYTEYMKKEAADLKKKSLAQEQIELTPEQEKRAKQLQQNIFKVFNKLDEKSQTFSESTEALGETVQSYVAYIPILIFCASMLKTVGKMAPEDFVDEFNYKPRTFIPAMAGLLSAIIFNVLITKEQKSASRVADMMALKETDDFRHFVDYSNVESTKKDNRTSKKVPEPVRVQKAPVQSNISKNASPFAKFNVQA